MSETQLEERNATLAVGSVKTHDQAGHLVAILKRAGFSDNDISVIAPGDEAKHDPNIALDHKPGDDPADEKPREGSDKLKGVTIGAVSGGLILGAIGGLVGLATLAIPGLGLIVVAGPIAAALTDAAAGGAAGLIAGALMGMRIPEHRAKQYEESVREGNTLISVHTRNADEFDQAMKCLATGGAEDLHEAIEAPADPQPIEDADQKKKYANRQKGNSLNNQLTVSKSDEVTRSLLGAAIVQDATREMPPPEDAPKKIPDEQPEEAEQDAADPTHEKEVPPENQKY